MAQNPSGREPTFLLVEKIRSLVEPIATAEGIELVYLELKGEGKGRTLRFFIDKPQGVTHADCESMSRQISAVLDVEGLVPGTAPYFLEVSSPGLDRPLGKIADFERFVGRRARIEARGAIAGRRNFIGEIAGVRGDEISLQVEGMGPLAFRWDNIRRAHLAPVWPAKRKG